METHLPCAACGERSENLKDLAGISLCQACVDDLAETDEFAQLCEAERVLSDWQDRSYLP